MEEEGESAPEAAPCSVIAPTYLTMDLSPQLGQDSSSPLTAYIAIDPEARIAR